MFFFLIALIVLLYFYKTGDLQRITNNIQGNNPPNSNEARRIIDIRYAKGELSEEEYTKMKNVL